MKKSLSLFAFALLALLPGCASHNSSVTPKPKPCSVPVHTPAKGTAERTAIISATRASMEKLDPSRKVVLVVPYLKVHCEWAWIQVNPQSPDGTQHYESQSGLLQKIGGQWKLLEWMPSEEGTNGAAYFQNLRKKYPAAPTDIFPK